MSSGGNIVRSSGAVDLCLQTFVYPNRHKDILSGGGVGVESG